MARPASLDARTYEQVTSVVAARSGMVFAANRRVEAEAGIARAMRRSGTSDAGAYVDLIRRGGDALDDLVDALTVGETHFMRDPDQLDLVRRELARIVRERGHAAAAPRVWSAGCSTGEEAYSLAILMAEAGFADTAAVLGTDLSSSALDRARAASYSGWSMRGVSAEFLQGYFRFVRGRRVLSERIRSRVRFERLNLVGDQPYASAGAYAMDLILCRNVLIYFDHATAGRIAARLFDCLAEGGVLLTAGADLLLAEYAPFEVEVTPVGLLYRRPRSGAARRALLSPASAADTAAHADAPLAPALPDPALPSAGPDLALEAFDRINALANSKGPEEAERVALATLRRHPLDPHLHYLRAVLLVTLDREEEADAAVRRALYLDHTLAVAHFLLATLLRRQGAAGDALRAFRNARDLCAGRPADEEVRAGSGERVGALHAAAAAEMEILEAAK